MSLENSIEDMAQVLKRKAPKLRPLVVPRLCLLGKGSGFGADSATARAGSPAGVLAALRRVLTPRQRKAVDAALASALATAREASGDDGALATVPVCELDVGARTVRITRFEFVGSVDAALRDLSGVLERQLSGDEGSDEDSLEPLVAHFNSANGYSEDAGPLPMQQCYTLAYALRVALNNAPGPEVDGSWHAFLGAHALPLPRPADAAEAIAPLLKRPPKQTGSPQPKRARDGTDAGSAKKKRRSRSH